MTFSNIFKKSFLEGFASTDINIYTAAAAFLVVSLLAVYIFCVFGTLAYDLGGFAAHEVEKSFS